MTELRFEAVTHAALSNVTATWSAGSHVVLGSEHDGTGTLIQLAAGLVRPSTGRVLLNGHTPYAKAATRRGIASLHADEPLLPGPSAARAIELALRARGEARSAASVLDPAGLAHLAPRRSATLNARERRALALALALSHPAPHLLALHEPLALVGIVSEEFVRGSLRAFAVKGALVLSSASRLEDALELGGVVSLLDRGMWQNPAQLSRPLASVTVRVRTPEPRRLAARLAEAPDISGVDWRGGQELLVRGNTLERVAHSVVANARAEAIRILALKQDLPALEVLAAARAGLAQAVYEQARSATEAGPG